MASNKERAINVRIDDKEYKLIQDKARVLNMKLSEYVRFVCLNAEIKVIVGGKGE
jgi:uncharacterized protein (DUF1778 family)